MNFKDLTYKQKYVAVLAGSLVVLVILYQFGIQKTIYYYQVYSEQNISNAENPPSEFDWDIVRQKNKALGRVLTHLGGRNENSERILLDAVSTCCLDNQVRLKDFGSSIESKDSIFVTYTNRIILEGSFKRLLKMIDQLEKDKKLGKICSVSFKSDMDFKTGKLKLTCIFYLRNLRQKESS